MYDLLEEMVQESIPPQMVIVDTPLLLERSDAPLESHEQLLKDYVLKPMIKSPI